ncbi:cobalamin biosynthesis protein CbiX [Protaetiibacter intestinalis]|uniref:Cobalamin biosynthesis protein CbiX n=1 Tax=Protaetiibacter intestinalis TaxID=2419774 RepID=A0A387BEM4_9MICO|nr:cobalamin biosynthesis protein CbiX [Protaetiibacter intestinalis]
MLAPPALLAISHGTSSESGAAAVAALVDAVAEAAPELRVRGGFVDVQQPDVPTVLGALPEGSGAVIVPLLLSAGFHVHVDLAEDAAAVDGAVVARALGPDDRLVALLARRLDEAGLDASDAVVLAAAGSTDARAVADCAETALRLGALLGREVAVGYISAARPRLSDAIAAARATHPGRRVVVASYLLAPGYFADLAADAGADIASAPLLAAGTPVAPELVAVVRDRYTAAR